MDGTTNPITEIRRRFALSQGDLAGIIGIPIRFVAVLEMTATRLPLQVIGSIEQSVRSSREAHNG